MCHMTDIDDVHDDEPVYVCKDKISYVTKWHQPYSLVRK